MKVLYSSFQVTLNTLHDKIGTVARDLQIEAGKQELLVTGPIYWLYYGVDGNPDTEFRLEIAIPIAGKPVEKPNMLYAELPVFKCLSSIHNGPWSGFAETYARLLKHVSDDGLKPNGVFREAYINIDFERQENNITEIQVGIS